MWKTRILLIIKGKVFFIKKVTVFLVQQRIRLRLYKYKGFGGFCPRFFPSGER